MPVFGLVSLTATPAVLRSALPLTVSATRLSILFSELKRKDFPCAVFPGRGAQVAQRLLALAIIDLGDLPELQRVALAGTAAKVIQDAAAHHLDRALAA